MLSKYLESEIQHDISRLRLVYNFYLKIHVSTPTLYKLECLSCLINRSCVPLLLSHLMATRNQCEHWQLKNISHTKVMACLVFVASCAVCSYSNPIRAPHIFSHEYSNASKFNPKSADFGRLYNGFVFAPTTWVRYKVSPNIFYVIYFFVDI